METLFAIDLTKNPKWQKLWQSNQSVDNEELNKTGLPLGGFFSPMGFYLFTKREGLEPTHQITFNQTVSFTATYQKLSRGRTLLKATVPKTKSYDEFTLEIGENQANITLNETDWDTIANGVILAITQCWRNYLIEKEILQISQYSYADLKRTSVMRISDCKYEKRYLEHDLTLRNLSHDMPYFEGPILDPYYYHSEKVTAEIYQILSEELDMESWNEHLANHLDVIKENYQTIIDKSFHYRGYFWTLTLEVLIVLILLVDLAIILSKIE